MSVILFEVAQTKCYFMRIHRMPRGIQPGTTVFPLLSCKEIQLMQYNLNWSFPNVRTSTNTLVFSEQGSSTKVPVQLTRKLL